MTEWDTPQGGLARNFKYLCKNCGASYYKTKEISSMMRYLHKQKGLDNIHRMRNIDDEALIEEKCEICGGEIITHGDCGACLKCDARWGEPEYVECEN
jgi:hypothetical protein